MKGLKMKTARVTDLIGSPTTGIWFLELDNGEKVNVDPAFGLRQLIGVYSTANNIIGQQIEYETNNLGILHRFRPVSND
jgi:hypothetical protein